MSNDLDWKVEPNYIPNKDLTLYTECYTISRGVRPMVLNDEEEVDDTEEAAITTKGPSRKKSKPSK